MYLYNRSNCQNTSIQSNDTKAKWPPTALWRTFACVFSAKLTNANTVTAFLSAAQDNDTTITFTELLETSPRKSLRLQRVLSAAREIHNYYCVCWAQPKTTVTFIAFADGSLREPLFIYRLLIATQENHYLNCVAWAWPKKPILLVFADRSQTKTLFS